GPRQPRRGRRAGAAFRAARVLRAGAGPRHAQAGGDRRRPHAAGHGGGSGGQRRRLGALGGYFADVGLGRGRRLDEALLRVHAVHVHGPGVRRGAPGGAGARRRRVRRVLAVAAGGGARAPLILGRPRRPALPDDEAPRRGRGRDDETIALQLDAAVVAQVAQGPARRVRHVRVGAVGPGRRAG